MRNESDKKSADDYLFTVSGFGKNVGKLKEVLIMKKHNIKWTLVIYDLAIFLFLEFLLLYLYENREFNSVLSMVCQVILSFICIFTSFISFYMYFYGKVYRRYLSANMAIRRNSVLHKTVVC